MYPLTDCGSLQLSCINFEGGTSEGYGMTWVPHLKKNVGAHRVSYCKHNNVSLESIEGLVVRHKCDNRLCVNPDHLEIGTHKDNARDRVERGRCNTPSGERNGSAKLSNKQVDEIREKYSGVRGEVSSLAREYGVGRSCISKILRGDRRVSN